MSKLVAKIRKYRVNLKHLGNGKILEIGSTTIDEFEKTFDSTGMEESEAKKQFIQKMALEVRSNNVEAENEAKRTKAFFMDKLIVHKI
jgi:hypothetical protein